MKKAIVTMAIGPEYEQVEKFSGMYRKLYAVRNEWDYIVKTKAPQDPGNIGLASACYLYKLFLPAELLDYDLVAFMDSDSIINPAAPCLSRYSDDIPPGGFAAAQTISYEQRRKVYPQWNEDYYVDIEKILDCRLEIRDRRTHINAGLLIFKPREVAKYWAEIANENSSLTGEQRLNLRAAQNGKCLLLPTEWHILWKYYRDEHYPLLGPVSLLFNQFHKATGIFLGVPIERQYFLSVLKRNYFAHLAFEHVKVNYFLENLPPEMFEARIISEGRKS